MKNSKDTADRCERRLEKIEDPVVWGVEYNREIICPDSFGGRIRHRIKLMLRNLLKPVISPIVDDQDRFNILTVQTIRELKDRVDMLQEEIDRLRGQDEQRD